MKVGGPADSLTAFGHLLAQSRAIDVECWPRIPDFLRGTEIECTPAPACVESVDHRPHEDSRWTAIDVAQPRSVLAILSLELAVVGWPMRRPVQDQHLASCEELVDLRRPMLARAIESQHERVTIAIEVGLEEVDHVSTVVARDDLGARAIRHARIGSDEEMRRFFPTTQLHRVEAAHAAWHGHADACRGRLALAFHQRDRALLDVGCLPPRDAADAVPKRLHADEAVKLTDQRHRPMTRGSAARPVSGSTLSDERRVTQGAALPPRHRAAMEA